MPGTRDLWTRATAANFLGVRVSPLPTLGARPWWPLLHLSVLAFLAIILPAGSLLFGNGEFAWTMFSKSETYRLAFTGIAPNGSEVEIDPRSLGPLTNPTLSYFLPEPGKWRHDPMGVTFRTGLPYLTLLACRLGPYQRIEALLEERAHLDAAPLATRAEAPCRQ